MENQNGDCQSAEKVIREVRELLHSLEQERKQIVRRICTIKKTIVGLASLYGEEIFDEQLLELVGRKTNKRR
jgi:hypothetical protein